MEDPQKKTLGLDAWKAASVIFGLLAVLLTVSFVYVVGQKNKVERQLRDAMAKPTPSPTRIIDPQPSVSHTTIPIKPGVAIVPAGWSQFTSSRCNVKVVMPPAYGKYVDASKNLKWRFKEDVAGQSYGAHNATVLFGQSDSDLTNSYLTVRCKENPQNLNTDQGLSDLESYFKNQADLKNYEITNKKSIPLWNKEPISFGLKNGSNASTSDYFLATPKGLYWISAYLNGSSDRADTEKVILENIEFL